MDAKLTPANRLDALDREAFRSMIESASFKLVRDRIAAELKRAEETCQRADNMIELRRAQGAAAALRAALSLPGKLIEEMQSKKA